MCEVIVKALRPRELNEHGVSVIHHLQYPEVHVGESGQPGDLACHICRTRSESWKVCDWEHATVRCNRDGKELIFFGFCPPCANRFTEEMHNSF